MIHINNIDELKLLKNTSLKEISSDDFLISKFLELTKEHSEYLDDWMFQILEDLIDLQLEWKMIILSEKDYNEVKDSIFHTKFYFGRVFCAI